MTETNTLIQNSVDKERTTFNIRWMDGWIYGWEERMIENDRERER